MTRLPRGVPAFVALLSLVAAAGPAEAKAVRHHAARHGVTPKRHARAAGHGPAHVSAYNFPNYIDHGSDRNPGGDNLYFSDTGAPTYFNGPNLIGPAYFQRWWSTTY